MKKGRPETVPDGVTLDPLRVSEGVKRELERIAHDVGLTVPMLRRHIIDRYISQQGHCVENTL